MPHSPQSFFFPFTYTREAGSSPTSTTAKPGLRSIRSTWARTSSFTLAARAFPSITTAATDYSSLLSLLSSDFCSAWALRRFTYSLAGSWGRKRL